MHKLHLPASIILQVLLGVVGFFLPVLEGGRRM